MPLTAAISCFYGFFSFDLQLLTPHPFQNISCQWSLIHHPVDIPYLHLKFLKNYHHLHFTHLMCAPSVLLLPGAFPQHIVGSAGTPNLSGGHLTLLPLHSTPRGPLIPQAHSLGVPIMLSSTLLPHVLPCNQF